MNQVTQISLTTVVLIAITGGFVLSMVNLWEDSLKPKNQRVPKDFLYWVFFLFWPAVGGGLAWIYFLDGSTVRPLFAFTLGLTAPSTIQLMMYKSKKTDNPPKDAEE